MEPALPNGMDLDEANPILVYGNETVYERLVRDDSMDEIVWRALFVKGPQDRRGGQREIWNADKDVQVYRYRWRCYTNLLKTIVLWRSCCVN